MNKWYGFNFRITRPENEKPRTWIDIFIIDKIIREVICKKKVDIQLWRIHRRWKNDGSGHEFTLDCFTKEQTANSIEKLIRESEPFKILQENSLLADDLNKVPNGKNVHDIADDESTRGWPLELKKAWPYYINGCCRMLLYLIEYLSKDKQIDGKNISKIENCYTKINNELTSIWQNNGSHAFFHHINAIFGYEPVILKMRFS